ncbi:MAG: hypothetical protein ABI145_14635 [Steroidobacteraceae bacterium]
MGRPCARSGVVFAGTFVAARTQAGQEIKWAAVAKRVMEPVAKRRNRVVIGVLVAGDEAKRYRIIPLLPGLTAVYVCV